jgi:hypothetical protein
MFSTESDADKVLSTWMEESAARGVWWAGLQEEDRQEVQLVYTRAKAAGLTLTRVWEDHQRWSREADKQSAVENKSYESAVNEWGSRKLLAGKSERYVEESKALLMRFGEGQAARHIHLFTPHELETWLKSKSIKSGGTWGLSSMKTNMSLFSSLWAVAVDKGWASYNIVDRLEQVTRPSPKIEIYDNATTMNILAGCMENDLVQKVLAPVVLGFFCCMRPEEVSEPADTGETFTWDCIRLKAAQIALPPEITKTGDLRTIRLQPNAVLWLKLCEDYKCPLPPVNERRLVDEVCEMIGLENWIRDGLRKNCATHLRAVYKNDYDVVRDCGNSVRILLRSYAKLNTPESVSLDHWKITPARVREYRKSQAWKDVLISAAKAQREQKANGTSTSES